MFAQFSIEKGWHYNAALNVYQKVNGRVFVYVSKLLFGSYMVQLYLRGYHEMSMCQLEAKTRNSDDLELIFALGENWLLQYHAGDLQMIHQDKYSILNPMGVWKHEAHLQNYWIK